jgi:hypothetical protein
MQEGQSPERGAASAGVDGCKGISYVFCARSIDRDNNDADRSGELASFASFALGGRGS